MVHKINDSRISLEGEWAVRLDPADAGVEQGWYGGVLLEDKQAAPVVRLPGSLTENGIGDDVTMETPWVGRIRDTSFFEDDRYEKYRQPDNIKVPFWLTPLKYYKGVAWFEREFDVPENWAGMTAHLRLERVHWTSRVWIDGDEVGFRDSLGAPHDYVAGELKPGRHRLTVRVDNRMHVNIGEDSNSISDHSQTNWNGIVGEIALWATPATWLDNVQVYPGADRLGVRVVAELGGLTEATDALRLDCSVRRVADATDEAQQVGATSRPAELRKAGASVTLETGLQLEEPAQPWGEFSPVLYEAVVRLISDAKVIDEHRVTFGFREFEARGTRFYLNGQPIFLRGTVEDCIFPLTGYPPTDQAHWRRLMQTLKQYGLNHMRFHSWCPPRAAFEAADREGVILSAECGSWTSVGENADYDEWLYREADAMLREYGNHPSFCMMLYGNEPYGDRAPQFMVQASEFLGKFVGHLKVRDDRRLYSGGTAWPQIPENDFHVWADPRIQLWDQNLDSRINARPPETVTDYAEFVAKYPVPVISHEIGQWCVYPNFEEIPAYNGVSRAYNFEIFRDFLEAAGMGDLAHDFLMASGRLQVLCYKEEIESQLRTRNLGGFQQLCLHDFPGQGSALVGVLDPFWKAKPYVNAAEYTQFCGPVVPLAQMQKRVFTNDEDFSAGLLISHFGENAIPAGDVSWSLQGDDGRGYMGNMATDALAPGELYELGDIQQPLSDQTHARRLTLKVDLPGDAGTNQWDVWVYPGKLEMPKPDNVMIFRELDSAAQDHLASGCRVLLLPELDKVAGDERGQVPPGFSSIFWNTAWTQGQEPHTLGILCDPQHPALREFPTEYHTNWQWWYVITNGRSMILDALPGDVRPIVRVIDDWFKARRLGLIFECRCGGGKLLVCSVDLHDCAGLDPVRRQLLFSLLTYVGSAEFAPVNEVALDDLNRTVYG